VAGDVGTIVHVYRDDQAYEVEFTTLEGKTAAVVTLEVTQIRPVSQREMTHARELAPDNPKPYATSAILNPQDLGVRPVLNSPESICRENSISNRLESKSGIHTYLQAPCPGIDFQ
jgi:hypothetical protein